MRHYKERVGSGNRTHAYRSRLGPERSALDRSAILTDKDISYTVCEKNTLLYEKTA